VIARSVFETSLLSGEWAIDLIYAIMWPLFDSEAYVGYFGGE
jgi:hypothetical protein